MTLFITYCSIMNFFFDIAKFFRMMNFTRFIHMKICSFLYLVFSLNLTMNKYSRFTLFRDFFYMFHFFTFFFKMPKVSKKQLNGLTKSTKKQDESLKKKRKSFTIAQKKEICLKKMACPFLKQKDLVQEYEVSEGMISDILKAKEQWLAVDLNSHQAGLKREKKVPFPNIEEALTIWVENALQVGLIITDNILSTKVLEFAFLLGENNFKGSNGWVDNFKKRHNL